MFINRNLIKSNISYVSILLFVLSYLIINYIKPHILYKKTGVLREFGIGYKNKTILPCWLLTILLAILSYFSILYFIAYPRLKY
jgi:hypothetical protein